MSLHLREWQPLFSMVLLTRTYTDAKGRQVMCLGCVMCRCLPWQKVFSHISDPLQTQLVLNPSMGLMCLV